MPVNNPDGYAYTWSDDRMWRKNRRKYDEDLCYGVDINRNFDDNFGGLGTSSNSCSETYHGPSAASEPETVATQDGIKDLVANADLQILYSIHSYSELWMYAFGYTYDLPPEAPELDAVSKIGVDALYAVNGILYEYGPIADTIYPAASTTVDYAYAQGIANSFTLELRDTGEYGFILPADQITPVGEETWAGLIASIMAIEV
ncbi:UNVERIFIED_CONTAM: hypothetical protein GTU68_012983 [Idotea baltica]|nr:hypothetical protein [Idotea baltica]